MSITRVKASSITQGLPKNKSVLSSNLPILGGSYESIATTTVGAGGTSTITFSSIPQTYKHLQIRASVRCAFGDSGSYAIFLAQVNSDSASGTYKHFIRGDGSVIASSGSETSLVLNSRVVLNGDTASVFSANICDILDYANTNKYKVSRTLGGNDMNTSGNISLNSSVWKNTAAITRLDLFFDSGNFTQYSTIALYGIK